jgi:hypothetical protein
MIFGVSSPIRSSLFSPEERDRVRERVFAIARADERVTGGAVTGSRSVGAEDRWSDVDTAFGVAAGVALDDVLSDWTEALERELDIVHHFDLRHGPTLYRVFLLSSALEVDISLTPASEFGARAATFDLVFGASTEQPQTAAPDVDSLIGFGWIYVLNARAGIERGRPWQAAHWIEAIRDQALALACVRHGLPAAHARGVDRLDPRITTKWEQTLVRSLEPDELRRALAVAAREFVQEVRETRPTLAERLCEVFRTSHS